MVCLCVGLIRIYIYQGEWSVGLMISALARTCQYLGEERYLQMAIKTADFIRKNLYDNDNNTLRRCWREGQAARVGGFCDDYSFMIQGLLDLHQLTLDDQWLEWAKRLQQRQDELFLDPNDGLYFNVSGEVKDVLVRMKEDHDGAEPAANSISLGNLMNLSAAAFSTTTTTNNNNNNSNNNNSNNNMQQNEQYYLNRAESMIKTFVSMESPFMPAFMSQVMHFVRTSLVISLPRDCEEMRKVAMEGFIPNRVISSVPSMEAVHVCERFQCSAPITDAATLKRIIQKNN